MKKFKIPDKMKNFSTKSNYQKWLKKLADEANEVSELERFILELQELKSEG